MQTLDDELFLNLHCLCDDCVHLFFCQLVLQLRLQQASEVCVQAFVSGDQLVGKCEARHQTSLLQPEYRAERSAEENALNSSECYKSSCEFISVVYLFKSPLGFLLNRVEVGDGFEQNLLLTFVFDLSVYQQRLGLRVYVLHRDLEPIESPSLSYFNLPSESLCKILNDDTVAGCEECEHHLDELLLIIVQFVPVLVVVSQVNLVISPE